MTILIVKMKSGVRFAYKGNLVLNHFGQNMLSLEGDDATPVIDDRFPDNGHVFEKFHLSEIESIRGIVPDFDVRRG